MTTIPQTLSPISFQLVLANIPASSPTTLIIYFPDVQSTQAPSSTSPPHCREHVHASAPQMHTHMLTVLLDIISIPLYSLGERLMCPIWFQFRSSNGKTFRLWAFYKSILTDMRHTLKHLNVSPINKIGFSQKRDQFFFVSKSYCGTNIKFWSLQSNIKKAIEPSSG